MGKGSGRRPAAISQQEWDANWARLSWDEKTGREEPFERKVNCPVCDGSGVTGDADGMDYCIECNGQGWYWSEL